jgi:hypothetical protein
MVFPVTYGIKPNQTKSRYIKVYHAKSNQLFFLSASVLDPMPPKKMSIASRAGTRQSAVPPHFLLLAGIPQSIRTATSGVPCAYLIPAGERGCNSHEFAEDLASAEMTAEDRHALAAAVRRGRKALKPLKNPWG